MEEFYPEKENSSQEGPKAPTEPIQEDIFSKKIISLAVGLLVVVLVISGGTYAFLKSKVKTSSKSGTSSRVVSQLSVVSSPAEASKTQKSDKTNTQSAQPSFGKGAHVYTDALFGYSVQIPENMETFKRVGTTDSYQIGVREIGHSDAPITISTQQNLTGENLSEWVRNEYGSLSQEAKKVGGVDAVLVRNDAGSYISYIIMNKSNVYEFSVSAFPDTYVSIFNQMLSTVTFSSR